MASRITVELMDFYEKLCPKCQNVLKDLIKSQMTDTIIEEQLKPKKGKQV